MNTTNKLAEALTLGLECAYELLAEKRQALAGHPEKVAPYQEMADYLRTFPERFTIPQPALAQRREPQWQPIETLPDDTLAILHGAKRSEMVIGMRHSRDGWVIDTPSEWASMYPPKHWMPLPAAPGATTGEQR